MSVGVASAPVLRAIVGVGLLYGCSATPVVPTPAPRVQACPKADSTLVQVASAPDPVAAGERSGVQVVDGRLKALVVFRGNDPSFLQQFGVVVSGTADGQSEVAIPFARLCDVANLDLVQAVRRVPRPVTP